MAKKNAAKPTTEEQAERLADLINDDDLDGALGSARDAVDALEICEGVECTRDFFGNLDDAVVALEAALKAVRALQQKA